MDFFSIGCPLEGTLAPTLGLPTILFRFFEVTDLQDIKGSKNTTERRHPQSQDPIKWGRLLASTLHSHETRGETPLLAREEGQGRSRRGPFPLASGSAGVPPGAQTSLPSPASPSPSFVKWCLHQWCYKFFYLLSSIYAYPL